MWKLGLAVHRGKVGLHRWLHYTEMYHFTNKT